MKTKNKSTSESIKSELNSILQMNAKRKSALEKISKRISGGKSKSNIDKLNLEKDKKILTNLKL